MGQTLSHGVYLPAEGERNCYSGLASNWNLLDTAIGDTAGKASATHTHGNISNDGKVGTTANLPLITGTGGAVQAGVFGNQANTFCEGNDSRLSDARTPVAHTHTKSDVTDLLNSNFIPSANNSYDLGSSSYQWNNLYAKSYYYNGVAWGLDKANEWTNDNTCKGSNLSLQNNLKEIGSSSSQGHYTIHFKDKNGVDMGFISHQTTFLRIGLSNKFTNGVYNPSGTQINNYLNLYVNSDGTKSADIYSDFVPAITNAYNLGTSLLKWKTLNGINPGGLSLPNYAKSANIDTTNWNTTGIKIDYTPPENCLIQIVTHNESGNKITVLNKYTSPEWGNCVCGNGQGNNLFFEKLLEGGRTYYIYITDTNVSPTVRARYVPLLGNV